MNGYIELKNVAKAYSGQTLLQDINLSIAKGTTVGVVGANGSGKSVLFKILCGFVKPDLGSVWFDGKELGKKEDFPDNVGVFINSPGFIGIYSGYKNLEFLANIRGVVGKREIVDAMQKVGLDEQNQGGQLFPWHEAKVRLGTGDYGTSRYANFR